MARATKIITREVTETLDPVEGSDGPRPIIFKMIKEHSEAGPDGIKRVKQVVRVVPCWVRAPNGSKVWPSDDEVREYRADHPREGEHWLE